jgi:hypothetical protein
MKNLDWFKTILISGAIVIAGYFIGNIHSQGND